MTQYQFETKLWNHHYGLNCEILWSNTLNYFYSEIRNFTIVLERPFVFLQRSTEFYSFTLTVIYFSQRNMKFRIVPFVLWLRNTKFLKLFRNCHLLFASKFKNLLLPKLNSFLFCFFWPWNTKSEVVLKRSFVVWLQTIKKEPNYLLFLCSFKADLQSANLSRAQFVGAWFFSISIWGERNVLST